MLFFGMAQFMCFIFWALIKLVYSPTQSKMKSLVSFMFLFLQLSSLIKTFIPMFSFII